VNPVIHNAKHPVCAIRVGNSADGVVMPLRPKVLRRSVHVRGQDGFSVLRQREVAVAGRNAEVVGQIAPVTHRVESRKHQIQHGNKPLIGRTVAGKLVRKGLYRHCRHGRILQVQGSGVKRRYRLSCILRYRQLQRIQKSE
jgi:hypothetical protein